MTPKTVTIAVALALVGVLLGMNYPTAEAHQDGPYALSAGGANFVWRMNTQSGQVSVCGVFHPQGILATPETSTYVPGEVPDVAKPFVPPSPDIPEDKPELDEANRRLLITPQCSPWGPITAR